MAPLVCSREMSIHVRSNYWGLVALTAISDGGGRKYLGTFMNSHEYRTIVVRKAIFSSGRLGFLLEPLGSNRFAAPSPRTPTRSRRTSLPSRVWTPS